MCLGSVRRTVVAASFLVSAVIPASAGRTQPYTGPFGGSQCAPGIVFTAWSMGWDVPYLERSNFAGLGGCTVPDLAAFLGTWQMTEQEIQGLGISNMAGKQLNIVPSAQFQLDATRRGVTVIEQYQWERFCILGAAASPSCAGGAPPQLAPSLPASALPVAPCRDSAVFQGAVRSDLFIQSGPGGEPSRPTGPFKVRASFREDMAPVSIRCPGADTAVVCRNCASMSIGKLSLTLQMDPWGQTLTATSDIGPRRLVQRYKRLSTLSLADVFNPDGTLK